MPDYFTEKAQQVEPATLVAFGIRILSRHGKARELSEMISFCKLSALENIAQFVKEMFYDSNSCMCTITLIDSVVSGDPVAVQLHMIAKQTIRQFDLFGYVDHGADLAEIEDDAQIPQEELPAKNPRIPRRDLH